MKQRGWIRGSAVFVCGSFLGGLLCAVLSPGGGIWPVAQAQDNPLAKTLALERLQQDLEMLKGKTPSQSHTMMDVDYHYTNLWFAAKAENWPLAEFYWSETLSHIRWAVRVIPVRKDNAGQEIQLTDILESIEQSPFMQVGDTIREKNVEGFAIAYRHMLEGCYSCHKASDKPYLRLRVPERPATSIVNFDPKATWPQ